MPDTGRHGPWLRARRSPLPAFVELAALPVTGHDWHPEWNYDITPPATGKSPKRKQYQYSHQPSGPDPSALPVAPLADAAPETGAARFKGYGTGKRLGADMAPPSSFPLRKRRASPIAKR